MHRLIAVIALLFAVSPAPTLAQMGDEILPPAFVETLLELPDDAAQAAKTGKRLLLYFGQPGCPYCKELMQTSFTQKTIVDKLAKHFVPMAFNLFGDREVTWFDGKQRSEKEFAKFLKVQFTPTLLLLDEKGNIIARINGFYPPHRFSAALDYSIKRLEGKLPFAEHMKAVPQTGANPKLNEQAFFMKPPFNLARKRGDKPLAVLFETRHCAPCDELHKEGFKREKTLAAMSRFDIARFSLSGREALITPDGRNSNAEAWSKELGVSYTPSVVFFDDQGKEVFRLEAYLRPFHFAGSFEYVGSGAYRKEPEFQRFLQNKAEHMKEAGEKLEMWK
ncbi:MAG: thioredoxin fold domain-containing protein [Burkholderiaceae bacterium]|nr:thioredoxin fold domain-containing protein [Sulfuritalea sp.]MCF8175969.1 thioredoxin fold domain-containing protein [Burkholderiaceae bacterium]MCF8183612.1 thioredoxin fold domain-containing protein [Polynucleobacter sp.]